MPESNDDQNDELLDEEFQKELERLKTLNNDRETLSVEEFDRKYPGLREAENEHFEKEFNRVIPLLSDIERKVINSRFGRIDGTPKVIDEICEQENISRFQLREIEQGFMQLVRPMGRTLLDKYLIEDEYTNLEYEHLMKMIEDTEKRWKVAELQANLLSNKNICTWFSGNWTDKNDKYYGVVLLNEEIWQDDFLENYGHSFNQEYLTLDSIYEQITLGYFEWSDELQFFIDKAIWTWQSEYLEFDVEFENFPHWRDRVRFAIAFYSFVTETNPTEISLAYILSCPRENFISSLMEPEARILLDMNEVLDVFKTRKEIDENLISKFQIYAFKNDDAHNLLRKSLKDSILFFLEDLVYAVYHFSWFGRFLPLEENHE